MKQGPEPHRIPLPRKQRTDARFPVHRRIAPPAGFASVVVLVALLSLTTPVESRRKAPAKRAQRVLKAKLMRMRRHRRTPRAAVYLMNLGLINQRLPKGALKGFADEVSRLRGLHPLARYGLDRLKAHLAAKRGRFGEAVKYFAKRGHVIRMAVTGPFGGPGNGNLEQAFGPEKVDGLRKSSRFNRKNGTVGWRLLPGLDRFGKVQPSMMVRPLTGGAVYLVAALEVRRAGVVALRLGTSRGYKLWVGRTLIAKKDVKRAVAPDQDAYAVKLPKGLHVVKVKLTSDRGIWPLYLRVTALDGGALKWVRGVADLTEMERASATMGPAGSPRSQYLHGESLGKLVTVQRYLEAQLAKKPKNAPLRKEMVRFLLARTPEDPRKEKTRAQALELVRVEDTPANYRLLARASRKPADRLAALRTALKKGPRDPDTLLLMTRHAFGRGKLNLAEQYLRRCLKERPGFVQARLLAAEILSARGLHVLARKKLVKIQKEVGWRQDLAQLLAEAHRSSGQKKEAQGVLETLVREDVAHLGARRILLQWALDRLDLKGALKQLEALRKARPYDTVLLGEQADLLAANGRAREARKLLSSALKMSPDDTTLLEILGRCHLVLGDKKAAKKAWGRALQLRPQSSTLRQRLAVLAAARPDPLVAEYALDPKSVVGGEGRATSEELDAMVLADRTVIQVLPNGMARRFRHRFVKVLNQRGVRTHRSWKVSYQPDAQRLRVVKARVWHEDGTKEEATTEHEISLSDPSVRVYYDYKQREIRFAKLQPGDVVEIQVALSDTADYSPFADYFGTIMSLQEASPRRRVDVILKAPKKIKFHYNKPALKGLKHTKRIQGGSQIHTWSAKAIPAFVSQPSMPGWAGVASYLHVSTFRSWSEVAKWYWNLIREQYHVNDALKKKVAQITRGLETDAQKIKALYRFVTRKIRYVSLSFGIHTHKPYSAPQVLARRFGDCKDKAMLLSVMLGLVGIKAHPVLVRTRPGGRLGRHPASIAVFDHAIVYVPSLKRYLDGTAEFTGSGDLPLGDQGVDALVVDGGQGTYTRTPVLPAKTNKMGRRLDVTLAADGSALVKEQIEITGQLAAEWRFRFQEAARRRELFQKALGRSFPGARIVTLKMQGIGDPERPVKVETTYRVPHLAQKKDGEMTLAFGRTRGSLVQRLAPLSRRRHPVELDYPFVSAERITLKLPKGVEVKETPRQHEAGKADGPRISAGDTVTQRLRFHQKVRRAGRVVTLERALTISLQRVPVKDYKTFRRFCSRVDSAVADRFVLKGGSKVRGGGS